MSFDAALVTSTDVSVRLQNSYEAVLSYVQARLSAGDYVLFQAQMATAGLPLTAAGILTLPNPGLLVDGMRILAMHFVTDGGRQINPATIATVSPVIAALQVEQDANVTGDVAAQNVSAAGTITAGTTLSVTGVATLAGGATSAGSVTVGTGLGVGTVAPATGIDAVGTVRGTRLQMNSTLAPAGATNGTLAEDTTGDLYYKDLAGTTRYITRPQHDTDWVKAALVSSQAGTLSTAYSAFNAAGYLGLYGQFDPNDLFTPDIHGGAPMTLLVPAVGDVGGPIRMQIWMRCESVCLQEDASGASPTPTGNLVAVCLGSHGNVSGVSLTSSNGVMVSVDQTTGRVSITVASFGGGGSADRPLLPGFPYTAVLQSNFGTDIDIFNIIDSLEIRVMIWTR